MHKLRDYLPPFYVAHAFSYFCQLQRLYIYRRWQKWKWVQNHFCTVPFLGQCAKYAKLGDLHTGAIFESYRGSKLCKIGEYFPIFAQPMCKIVFAPFLHSSSPLFERNDQLLRKRISLDYIKSKLLPIRLQKLKYRSSCISAKHLYGQIPYFGHGGRCLRDLISSSRRRISAHCFLSSACTFSR